MPIECSPAFEPVATGTTHGVVQHACGRAGGRGLGYIARSMSAPDRTLVWLFDVDGTLLTTERSGQRSMALALEECHGVRDDLDGIRFSGRTDPLIVADILARHALTPDAAQLDRLWDSMLAHMRRLMTPPKGGLLPGVPAMLDAVAAEPRWVSALLTGNRTEMARIKLSAFGVGERFDFGTFGEEGSDRDALACLAVRRAAERHGVPSERCVVVGDTEHDVACARAAGAHAVAVATGSRSRAQLAASRPDLLLDDLTDAAALLDWARDLGSNGATPR